MNQPRFSPPRSLSTKLLVYWYRVRINLKSKKWWISTGLLIGFWIALGMPVYEKGLAQGIAHTMLALILAGGRARRYAAPRDMQLVEHEYLTRKGRLYSLLKKLMYRERMSATEVTLFQEETLQLIASYVRGFRADLRGTEIFTNLVIEDGDDLVVVARDRDHRQPAARYPKADMVAWEAIQTGEAAVVGDLQAQIPHVGAKKRYRSILSVPIFGPQGVVGAVSIDSLRPHDFDSECDKLVSGLAPYVCLLGWTLIHCRPTLSSGSDITAKGGSQC